MKEALFLAAGFALLAAAPALALAERGEPRLDNYGCMVVPILGADGTELYLNDYFPGQCYVPEGNGERLANGIDEPGKDKPKGDRKRGNRGGWGKGPRGPRSGDNGRGRDGNRSGLGDGTNPGQGAGRDRSPNQGTNNPGGGRR